MSDHSSEAAPAEVREDAGHAAPAEAATPVVADEARSEAEPDPRGGVWRDRRLWIGLAIASAMLGTGIAWYLTRDPAQTSAPVADDPVVAENPPADAAVIAEPVSELSEDDEGATVFVPRCDAKGHAVIAEGRWHGPLLASDSRLFWRQQDVLWTVPKSGGAAQQVACKSDGNARCSDVDLVAVDDSHGYWLDDDDRHRLARVSFTRADYAATVLHAPLSSEIGAANAKGVFWRDKGDIVHMRPDGRSLTRWPTGAVMVDAVTADQTYVYWTAGGQVWRATHAGQDKTLLVESLSLSEVGATAAAPAGQAESPARPIGDLAVARDWLVLASPRSGELFRVSASRGGPPEVLASGLPMVRDLVADGGHVYIGFPHIARVSLVDKRVQKLSDETARADTLQVDGSHLYWVTDPEEDLEEDEGAGYEGDDDDDGDENEGDYYDGQFYDGYGGEPEPDPTEAQDMPSEVHTMGKRGGEVETIETAEYAIMLTPGGDGVWVTIDEYDTTAVRYVGGVMADETVSIPGWAHHMIGVDDRLYVHLSLAQDFFEHSWLEPDMGLFMNTRGDDELRPTVGSRLRLRHVAPDGDRFLAVVSQDLAVAIDRAGTGTRFLAGNPSRLTFSWVAEDWRTWTEIESFLDWRNDPSATWRDLARIGDTLVWHQADWLWRMHLKDGATEPLERDQRPRFLVPAKDDIFWLDGTAVWHQGQAGDEAALFQLPRLPRSLAVAGSELYASVGFDIMRGPAVGATPESMQVWLTAADAPADIAVDDEWVYWMTDAGPVRRHPRAPGRDSGCQTGVAAPEDSGRPALALPGPVLDRVRDQLHGTLGVPPVIEEAVAVTAPAGEQVVFAVYQYSGYELCIRERAERNEDQVGCLPDGMESGDGTSMRPHCLELGLARLVFEPSKAGRGSFGEGVVELTTHELESECTLAVVLDLSADDLDGDREMELLLDLVTEAEVEGLDRGAGFSTAWKRQFHLLDADSVTPASSHIVSSFGGESDYESGTESCHEGEIDQFDVNDDGVDDLVLKSQTCQVASCSYSGLSEDIDDESEDSECAEKGLVQLVYDRDADEWLE